MTYIKIVTLIYVIDLCGTALGALVTNNLYRHSSLSNNVCYENERVFNISGASVVRCAERCSVTSSCGSIFYSKTAKECYGCSGVYTVGSALLAATGTEYYGFDQPIIPAAATCLDHLNSGFTTNGVYTLVTPVTNTPIPVYCDMVTQGGGWIVFQRRFDGTEDFERTFAEYDMGFGDPYGEYWLGLKYLQEFVSVRPSHVYLEFTDFSDVVAYEHVENMQLSPGPQYTLTLGPFIAVNDSATTMGFLYNDIQPFSTFDNIQNTQTHCPDTYHGGWWYDSCTRLNANGWYGTTGQSGRDYIYNLDWQSYTALKGTKLMIREF